MATKVSAIRHPRWPWVIGLLAGALPILTTHLVYVINIEIGSVQSCWPYWDGCTSISRAARSGPGLMLFRLLMIPSAMALAVLWLLLRDALIASGIANDRQLRWQTWLGVLGALFLAVYVTYLGESGPVYRWLRSYGVYGYFGLSALAQLKLMALLQQASKTMGRCCWQTVARWHRWLTSTLWVLGIVFAGRELIVTDPVLRDRLENAVEWVFALLLNTLFLTILWLVVRLKLRLVSKVSAEPHPD